jgi:HEPN domain-containing protein
MSSENERSTPLGLFNFARSYWQSAVLLHSAKAPVSHPHAPVTLLLAHSIELYLKAFLGVKGIGINELKTHFGHDFRALVEEAAAQGLSIDNEDREISDLLAEQESIRRSRYIETGYFRQPSLPGLSRMCRSLDGRVTEELRTAGANVQSVKLRHIEEG